MRRESSLAARAFLFAFFPMCLMLAATFFTINASVRSKIKASLKESMLRTDKALDAANADYKSRNSQLIEIVSEDAGIKAAIGLLREVPYGQEPDRQVLKNVGDQLRELAGTLDYDVVMLFDSDGKPITGLFGQSEEIPSSSFAAALELFPLVTWRGTLYEGTAVPINLGSENLGSLILAKKFDIGSPGSAGYAALVYNHKVLVTNFPHEMVGGLEGRLNAQCADGVADCEIPAAGEDYLAVRVQRASLGEKVELFKFQSVDAAMNEFLRGFTKGYVLIGIAGVLTVLILCIFVSRSLSKPLTDLIGLLNESERTGRFESHFSVQSSVKEVNQLSEAFNRAADAIQESQAHLETASLQFVETMAQALDARDPYTAGHSNRVSVNATAIAEEMSLPPEQVEIIRIGARLHDIGKIGVPDAVLQKPGALTDEEYALIKLHPQIGKKILEKVARFQAYLPIVELHHEDYDGGGYPHRLKGDAVPLGVRIVHVADVYDAITSDRAYRKAMTEEQVEKILTKGSGKQFDPAVLDVFLKVLSKRKALQEILEQSVTVIANHV